MKKSFLMFLSAVIALSGFALVQPQNTYAKTTVPPGSIIKGKSHTTLYYVGEDGKRYVYPNAQTFFSWFSDFDAVEEIEDDELQELPLGGNVRYRPGVLLVKITSDPKVYAVGEDGKLRWIKSEGLAIALYGKNWNKLIDDVPDSFFVNYEVGDDIDEEDDFDPEEEEEQVPTPSHNRGFKNKVRVLKKNGAEGLCRLLTKKLNTLQDRLERLGEELPDVGDELLEKCYGLSGDDSASDTGKKLTLCHKESQSISVGAPAARAHFAHGDEVGRCEDGNGDDNGDDDGDEDDDDNGEVVDDTAPIISDLTTTVSASSTLITWTTDEAATSMTTYATSTLETATDKEVVENLDLVTSHSLELFDLLAATEYFFQVDSTDEAGNSSESATGTFTTEAE